MSIEGIALEHFSASTKCRYQFNYTITSTSCSFSIFLSYDSKQDADTNNAHIKKFYFFAQRQKVLKKSLSTIWENTDGCAK